MKIVRKESLSENLLYFLVWAVVLLVPVFNSRLMFEMSVNFDNVLVAWRQLLPYLVIFLVHNYLLAPRLMLTHRYVIYVLVDLVVITVIFLTIHFLESNLHFVEQMEIPQQEAYRKGSFQNLAIQWNILLGFFMTGVNTGIKLIYQSIRDEHAMAELKQRNLQAEMEYLKYQVNPHFFMNTLNNIHALIDIDTQSAKSAVIDLSKMMRYVLYESGKERISLQEDIQFVSNYIELMRIRYTDDVEIRMETPDEISSQVFIPPLILIVFVENAFKHGISYNNRSFIHITIRQAENRVFYTIRNSRHTAAKYRVGGIGLENIKKRLALLYSEQNYSLEIRETTDEYIVNLEIPTLHA